MQKLKAVKQSYSMHGVSKINSKQSPGKDTQKRHCRAVKVKPCTYNTVSSMQVCQINIIL